MPKQQWFLFVWSWSLSAGLCDFNDFYSLQSILQFICSVTKNMPCGMQLKLSTKRRSMLGWRRSSIQTRLPCICRSCSFSFNTFACHSRVLSNQSFKFFISWMKISNKAIHQEKKLIRNRKHVFISIKLQVKKHKWKSGRMRNAVGTQASRQVFPELFWVLANFHLYMQVFQSLKQLEDQAQAQALS